MAHIFDPDVVDACARKGIGKPKPEMFDSVADALEEHYPGHIDRSQPWIYSIAGGAMIQFKLYHCSLNEYIMIWGTPIHSGGHTGRNPVDFWDTVIDGETWYYAEGQFERTVYKPGDRIFVGKYQTCGMDFTSGVWAVEYARGPLPLLIPFGLADVLLSTMDFRTAALTLTIYGSLYSQHLLKSALSENKLLGPFVRAAASLVDNAARRATQLALPPPPLSEIPHG